jgi:hypothetical protein
LGAARRRHGSAIGTIGADLANIGRGQGTLAGLVLLEDLNGMAVAVCLRASKSANEVGRG